MKWSGYTARHNSWVKEADMNCAELIEEFEATLQIVFQLTNDQFLVRFRGDDLRNLTAFSRDDLMKNHATKLQQFSNDGFKCKLTRGFCHLYDILIDSDNHAQKIKCRRKTCPEFHAENIMDTTTTTTPTIPTMPITPPTPPIEAIEAIESNEANSSTASTVSNRLQIFNQFNPFTAIPNRPFFLRKKRLKSMF